MNRVYGRSDSASSTGIAFLDVGHGNCTVAWGREGAVVVDCPPGNVLRDFLRSMQIDEVRHLVLSHADADHIGGVGSLVESGIPVRRVWFLDDRGNSNADYRWLLQVFRSARARGAVIRRDYPHSDVDPVNMGGLFIEFLGPHHEDRADHDNRNSMSVVVRVFNDKSGIAVLPGDLDHSGFRLIEGQDRDFGASWLVAPHHGGRGGTERQTTSLIESLIARTDASRVVFSNGRRGGYRLPRRDVVEVACSQATVHCTQLSSTCMEDDLAMGADVGGFPHPIGDGIYRNPRESCAGSIVLDLSTADLEWGGTRLHKRFVGQFAGRMCAGAQLDT